MKKIWLVVLLISLGFLLGSCKHQKEHLTFEMSELGQAVMYEVNIRCYTEAGTFLAFKEHLPRLKELGVDVLWFMPIHPISKTNRLGSLGSYYSITDYYGINPEFGNHNDFKELVEEAHKLGFKVMMDMVFNHTGWDCPWISEHRDWYTQDDKGNILIPEGTSWTDVADLNFDKPALRAELIKVLKYWVSEFDVDGFRCDAAGRVPRAFWEEAILALRPYKTLFWLAEDDADITLVNHLFHANYSFEYMNLIKDVVKCVKRASQIQMFVNRNKGRYPLGTFPLLYTSNHDVNSWEGPDEMLLGAAKDVFSLLTFTIPGMPLIYSGQEVNNDKSLAFFEKDEIVWDDVISHPRTLFYKQLISLRKDNLALSHLAMDNVVFLFDGNEDTLCFVRSKGDNTIIVIVNLSNKSQSLEVDLSNYAGSYVDYFGGGNVKISGVESFGLGPWGYRVFVK